jgi:hypothetical protein
MAENVLHDRPLTGGDEQHGRTATTGLAPMSRVRMLIGYANPAEMDATTTAFCVAGVSEKQAWPVVTGPACSLGRDLGEEFGVRRVLACAQRTLRNVSEGRSPKRS